MTARCLRALAAIAGLAFAALGSPAGAQTHLTTMVFQGVQNLPLFAAQQKGFFAKHGLVVDQKIAPNSQELRDGLAQGRYQIVHTSVDNAIAMAEQAKVDIVVVCGGDNGWNDLLVQPEINPYADLRGKTVVVDAPDTAFAFQLYQMLKLNGVAQGEYTVKPVGATRFRLQAITTDKSVAASILNLPFSLQAEQAGIKKLATATDVIGPYLSTTAFVLRSWARDNDDALVPSFAAMGLPPIKPGANHTMVVCEEGTLLLQADGLPQIFRKGKEVENEPMPEIGKRNHWKDWADNCLGDHKPLWTPFQIGWRITEPALLAVKATRFPGEELRWNSATCRFTNHDQANKEIISRTYRPGFEPPVVS